MNLLTQERSSRYTIHGSSNEERKTQDKRPGTEYRVPGTGNRGKAIKAVAAIEALLTCKTCKTLLRLSFEGQSLHDLHDKRPGTISFRLPIDNRQGLHVDI